jgi:hypothetical protein
MHLFIKNFKSVRVELFKLFETLYNVKVFLVHSNIFDIQNNQTKSDSVAKVVFGVNSSLFDHSLIEVS